jgi:serine/threonine protein kinase
MTADGDRETTDADPDGLADLLGAGLESRSNIPEVIVFRGRDELLRYPLDWSPIRVGRASDNEIVLDDRRVSRHHAVILNESGQWWIRDAGSQHKIRIRGRTVEEHALNDGDRVGLGPYRLLFYSTLQSVSEPVSPTPASPHAAGELDSPGSGDFPFGRPLVEVPGYEIVREIGRGGMGRVYEAVQLSTQRTVALKIMLEGPFTSERTKRRFEREVRIVATLRHPNIAQIYESGLHEGRYWFAMEYVQGERLTAAAESRKLSLRERLEVMAAVCEAVGHAHRQMITHRDLKPGNILISEDGQPHVLDFGLAKIEDPDRDREITLSVPGELMGTPAYMSPEQTRRDPSKVDLRTDVYTLGVILYQLLTGSFPYDVSGRLDEVIHEIATGEPTPPSQVRNGIDDETEAIVLKAITKDPDQRYASAVEMGQDLRRRLAGEPVEAKLASRSYLIGKAIRRHRNPIIASAALLFVVAVTATVTKLMMQGEPSDRPDQLGQIDVAPDSVARDHTDDDPDLTPKGRDVSARQASRDSASQIAAEAPEPASVPAPIHLPVLEESDGADKALLEPASSQTQTENAPVAARHEVAQGLGSPTTPSPDAEDSDGQEALEPEILIHRLEGAIESNHWAAAHRLWKRLGRVHAQEPVESDFEKKLEAWETEIREGLNASAEENERRALIALVKVERLLEQEDYLRAYPLWKEINEELGDTAVVAREARKIEQFGEEIHEVVDENKCVDRVEYVLNPYPVETGAWLAARKLANDIVARWYRIEPPLRIVLLRIVLEDESREEYFLVHSRQLDLFGPGGGHSAHQYTRSGDVLIVGAEGDYHGDAIMIDTLYHWSPTIKLEFHENQPTVFGEILIRAVPNELRGSLIIEAEPEYEFPILGGTVAIARQTPRLYDQRARPLEPQGRCVFAQIASGDYQIVASCKHRFNGRMEDVRVDPGKTTHAKIILYRTRIVEIEWMFRRSQTGQPWRIGETMRLHSGTALRAPAAWDVSHQVLYFSDWSAEGGTVGPTNCRSTILQAADFRDSFVIPPDDQLEERWGHHRYPLRAGMVFALRRTRGDDPWEALIRIRSVTPVSVE